jgi:hypothetical protein
MEVKMAIAHPTRFEIASSEPGNHDVRIIAGYAAFALVLLIAIYLASLPPGTAPGDLAASGILP